MADIDTPRNELITEPIPIATGPPRATLLLGVAYGISITRIWKGEFGASILGFPMQ